MRFRVTYETVTAVADTLTYEPFQYSTVIEAPDNSAAYGIAARHGWTLREWRFMPVVENGEIIGSNWLEATVEPVY